MHNPRLAHRYAKALIDIANEKGKLEEVYMDMQGLSNLCNSNADFVQMIKSPIVKGDKKKTILKAILSGKVGEISEMFINLIITKGRDSFLPEIANAAISLYKEQNNITDVTLTTSEPLDADQKATLESKITAQLNGKKIDLKTLINPALIGGFVLEANNNMFDASILRDLNDIKKQFLLNHYIPNIR